MEEIKITKEVSNTAICEFVRRMQENYQAVVISSEESWRENKAELLDEMKALLPKCDRVNGYVCPLSKDDCFDCMYESFERIAKWIKVQEQKWGNGE